MDDRKVLKYMSYKLCLGKYIDNSQQPKTDVEFVQRSKETVSLNSVSYGVSLLGVKFNRRIYQPGEIDAELDIVAANNEVPTAKAVSDFLLRRRVDLYIVQKDEKGQEDASNPPICIAQNYYVYEINPQLTQQSGGNMRMSVKLTIFSMDKLMTLDKYSKAYVVKKLGSGILDPESRSFGFGEKLIAVNRDHLRQLKYNQQMTISKLGSEVSVQIPSEFIHPYLVQYNETFYDFMARTANRCGEFFYFEDGKLILGLPESKTPYQLDSFQTVTYQNLSASPLKVDEYVRDSMKDGEGEVGDTNYSPVRKNAAGFPNDAFPLTASYNAEVSVDEYFFPLYADKFTSFAREMGYAEKGGDIATQQVFSVLESAASSADGIGGFVSAVAIDTGKSHKEGFDTTNETNDEGNETYIDKYVRTEQGDGEKTVLFGSVRPDGWTTLRYYQDVRRYEEEQQRQMVCIDLGTSFVALKLGEQIKVKGLDSLYVIVEIRLVSNEMWTRNYEKYGDDGTSDKYNGKQSMKVFAIPVAEVKNAAGTFDKKPFPPVLPVQPVRKAEAQTAFVTDNEDPKYQGRVRIVYPWQSMNMPERKALEEAEKTLMEKQQEYDEKKARFDKMKAALDNWKFANAGKLRKFFTKFVMVGKISKISDEIDSLGKSITLYGELDKLLQSEADLVRKQCGKKGTEAAAALTAEVDKLKTSYPDYSKEIKSLSKKKEPTNEEQARLTKLKSIDALISRLTLMAGLLANETRQDEIDSNLSGLAELFETEIDGHQTVISDKTNEKQACEQLKEKLKQDKDDLDLSEDDFKKTLDTTVTQDDVDAANKELEKAKESVKTARQNVDAKAKDYTNALGTMATPWIRVASPMATEGGGTFFKPMVGDEVLVNFESGNIERPYVVGSLYSKNILAPDERINRTVGPNLHANASIAIVSPNGHGITFKDPTKGDGFFTSVYPGLGVFNEYAGKIGASIPLPKTKDVTGGIRIGDRYGLYSIEMSSDKRSVSIESSMGTVKLNAFTGISISAPNGDIKIEGKNVSIKAGNNLSLTSGMNIKKGVSSDTVRGFFLSKVDMALGMAGSKPVEMFVEPFLDASLFRTVLEVFLKPIEGTMLVKSKRYLKLEAGSGKTVISKDRYKDWDPNKLEKMASSQAFFKEMMDAVNDMNDRLNKFKVLYRPLWTDAAQKRDAYVGKAKQFYKDIQLKEYLEKALKVPANEEWSDARNIPLEDIQKMELKKNALWFRDSVAVKNAKDKDEKKKAKEEDKKSAIEEFSKQTEPVLNEFMKAIHTLHQHFDSFEHIYDDLDDQAGFILKSMKGAFDYARTLGFTPYDLNSIDKDSKPDKTFSTGIRTFKRQVAGIFMILVASHPDYKDKEFIKVDYLPDEMTVKKVKDSYLWNKFLGEMEEKAKHPLLQTVVDSLKDSLSEAVDADGWKKLFGEKEVWNDRKGGQILFSDDENSTVNLDGGAMSLEQQSQSYNLDKLKQLLAGLD